MCSALPECVALMGWTAGVHPATGITAWAADRPQTGAHKFSMNWLGSSTASHSTPRMPATRPSLCSVSMCCRACPLSWNSVSTSLQQAL